MDGVSGLKSNSMTMVNTFDSAPTIVSRFELVKKRYASPVHSEIATWTGLILKTMTRFHAADMAIQEESSLG